MSLQSTELENKNVHFSTYGKDIAIKSDRNHVFMILRNLVENAGKYSLPNTNIEISCKTTQEWVTFCVKDQGIGIPEEEQGQIFDSFRRASNSNNIEGMGLGLAIVKKSLVLLGGKVELRSDIGKGTSVTVGFKNFF